MGKKRTVSGEERDGCALSAGTASSTNTMDVILRVVGVVIVEHMGNVAHIFETRKWLANSEQLECKQRSSTNGWRMTRIAKHVS
jgi:hypothetical protein